MHSGAEVSRWYVHSSLLKMQEGKGKDTPASLMREMLCRLGPAFIKIGQALSRWVIYCSCPDVLLLML